ncbi:MAG TPA: right-handed parallel beta-helix repeat-containing protein, partial [Actinomycetota bacterium]|nr:right-handed parallel beta-helix repeat-containing protein [Actinomycetota bacterium]
MAEQPKPPPISAPAQSNPGPPGAGGIYRGTDPSRDLKPFTPKPLNIVRRPGTVPVDRGRSIVLTQHAINLLESATRVRHIHLANPGREIGLEEIVNVVNDPGWVRWDGDGIVLLQAALLQDVGTKLRVSQPAIREVRLASLPGVFLGGTAASALIEGVLITSWLPDRARPDTNDRDGRPFILYEDEGAQLDIINSEIAYLGEDRVTAYGLAWRQGATGTLLGSEVHHNLFGVYTHEAKDMAFRGNRLHHNIYYGFDPHDYSSGLIIEDNEAWSNGSHGIIFSRGVVNSVVRRNYSHDNGGNGIMMDAGSNRNEITVNRVENNLKDGIVAHGSSDLLIADNLIRGNRQGIRSKGESLRNQYLRNRLVDNNRGIELYGGVRNAVIRDNVVRGSREIGLILDAPGSRVLGGTVDGGELGVDARAPASLSGLVVGGVDRGLLVRRGTLDGYGVTVEARKAAVTTEGRALVRLVRSNVRSDKPALDADPKRWGPGTEEQGPPLPWTTAVGIGLIAAAVALEAFHRFRLRRTPGSTDQP